MRTFTHDGITYRLERSQALVFEARKNFFNKFESHPRDAETAALILTLEQFFTEFTRSESDQKVINRVAEIVAKELA
jgi:hypothetical protein